MDPTLPPQSDRWVIHTNERPARVIGAGNSMGAQAATIHREGRARDGHRIARDHERLGLLLRRAHSVDPLRRQSISGAGPFPDERPRQPWSGVSPGGRHQRRQRLWLTR